MKLKRQNIDSLLLGFVSILIVIGSVMVYSSSSALAEGSEKISSHAFFFKRQLIWVLLAFAVMIMVSKIDPAIFRPFIFPALMLGFALLIVVYFTPQIRYTHRWLNLGFITIQPSELFKYILVFYLAHSLSQKGRDLGDLRQYRWPYGPIILAGLALIVFEPDLGSTLVLGTTIVVIIFLAGAKLTHVFLSIGASTLSVYLLVMVAGYKKSRIDGFLAAWGDPLLAPHQLKQAILSLSCGGVFGVGLGNGVFKQYFLPEPHTDFILASIGEELGLVGLLVTMGLLFGLIWRGMKIAMMQTDRFSFLLASGLTSCLAVNIMINIAVVLGLIPTTGLTLPFLSYGGSSLIVSAMAVGLLLSLSRQKKRTGRVR